MGPAKEATARSAKTLPVKPIVAKPVVAKQASKPAAATKSAAAKSSTAKSSTAKSSTPKSSTPKSSTSKSPATKSAAAKPAKGRAEAPKAPTKAAVAAKAPLVSKISGSVKTASLPQASVNTKAGIKAAGGGHQKVGFLKRQRELLLQERDNYLRKANELKAQADLLAAEQEPGDVQFDEEGGEGGTANVDRELDLVLSGQAHAAITEIDHALSKMDHGNYGLCEKCNQPIPEARLEALPHASLCVACKSGGLSSRR